MRVTGDGHDERWDCLQVYDGHFFSRFRERMKLSSTLSTNEVIATFFGRNGGYFTKLNYEDIVLKKNRHKGNSAWGVDDGVILSEEHNMGRFWVFIHNTFLSWPDLKPSQADATPSVFEMHGRCMSEKNRF